MEPSVEYRIKGVPIEELKVRDLLYQIRKRGGSVPTGTLKEEMIVMLKKILYNKAKRIESQTITEIIDPEDLMEEDGGPEKSDHGFLNSSTETPPTMKRSFEQNLAPFRQKKKSYKLETLSGFSKEAFALEETILKKEYIRFIIIKILKEHGGDSDKTYPPPLINYFWSTHILDTSRYEEFCNLFKKRVHYCPDILEDLSVEEKRKRFNDTINYYKEFFLVKPNNEIWDDGFLDEENNNSNQFEEEQKKQDQEEKANNTEENSIIKKKHQLETDSIIILDEEEVEENKKKKQKIELNIVQIPTPENKDNTTKTGEAAPTLQNNYQILDSSIKNNDNTDKQNIMPQIQKQLQQKQDQENISSDPNKITIGFVQNRSLIKEITNFRGVAMDSPLSKVIRAFVKLKTSEVEGCRFFYGSKEVIQTQTPKDLGMKNGDTINVSK
ncbi:hypothetical protein DICPUDRAFT_80701 [Dictyostelium purpureum]|uniref:Rad60/SUMO-like domain-containing protein n=1 Tax=Dictyostelium purpureum TaxID=5786 RepID=F0ZR96_DICPU|nr:uncharacterized protein DICPUDRAFT_80701 [Dictyostelium purpureum]EGC33515.1 hypothetical protein DICPUDRAFT_80701 [Dictyostelium purpureum]|eukprot:XP_003289940.1 hypothetical protein DICPUDRAFT_80701 [Dictyostelium purpureum]